MTTESLQLLGVDSGTLPPMGFQLPVGLHTVEVSLDAEERATAVTQLVRDIYPLGEEPLWDVMSATYSAMADEMLSNGVSFFGIGLYDIGNRGVAHCALTVAVFESDQTDQDVVAHGTLKILSQDRVRDVRWLDLPCGPAVSAISLRSLLVDGKFTRDGTDQELLMGQIQVHVPFSTGPYTAVFTLDTASMDQWDDFSRAMADIVRSVDFNAIPPQDGQSE
ncbi:hypothetical protein [Streptomyces sp. NBC_01197]|uniref:hypothetical protein n=1 Tax=Streptomyces sp. NBC_01197 TaxID=2903768 RepID=UPI002E0E9989|nr:hypothetical protein OG452_14205 [Streptomyces sp. NBC_01197]